MAQSRTLSYQDEFGPGPGFLPYWLGLLLTALSVALIVSAKSSGSGSPAGRTLLSIAGLSAMTATLNTIGFIAGFGLLSFFLVYVIERRSLRHSLMVALCMSAGFLLLFHVILPVPLPAGPWGF